MRPAAKIRSLFCNTSGVALVEFALSVPIVLLLFVGGYQISDAVFAYRKVTATARTVADLTSQYTAVTDSDLDTILNASQQVLSPYPVAAATIVISQVTINASGSATVSWSRGKNTAGYNPGSWFFVPPAYKQNNTTVVVCDIKYTYKPNFASSIVGTMNLVEQVTMYPRKSTTITKS